MVNEFSRKKLDALVEKKSSSFHCLFVSYIICVFLVYRWSRIPRSELPLEVITSLLTDDVTPLPIRFEIYIPYTGLTPLLSSNDINGLQSFLLNDIRTSYCSSLKKLLYSNQSINNFNNLGCNVEVQIVLLNATSSCFLNNDKQISKLNHFLKPFNAACISNNFFLSHSQLRNVDWDTLDELINDKEDRRCDLSTDHDIKPNENLLEASGLYRLFVSFDELSHSVGEHLKDSIIQIVLGKYRNSWMQIGIAPSNHDSEKVLESSSKRSDQSDSNCISGRNKLCHDVIMPLLQRGLQSFMYQVIGPISNIDMANATQTHTHPFQKLQINFIMVDGADDNHNSFEVSSERIMNNGAKSAYDGKLNRHEKDLEINPLQSSQDLQLLSNENESSYSLSYLEKWIYPLLIQIQSLVDVAVDHQILLASPADTHGFFHSTSRSWILPRSQWILFSSNPSWKLRLPYFLKFSRSENNKLNDINNSRLSDHSATDKYKSNVGSFDGKAGGSYNSICSPRSPYTLGSKVAFNSDFGVTNDQSQLDFIVYIPPVSKRPLRFFAPVISRRLEGEEKEREGMDEESAKSEGENGKNYLDPLLLKARLNSRTLLTSEEYLGEILKGGNEILKEKMMEPTGASGVGILIVNPGFDEEDLVPNSPKEDTQQTNPSGTYTRSFSLHSPKVHKMEDLSRQSQIQVARMVATQLRRSFLPKQDVRIHRADAAFLKDVSNSLPSSLVSASSSSPQIIVTRLAPSVQKMGVFTFWEMDMLIRTRVTSLTRVAKHQLKTFKELLDEHDTWEVSPRLEATVNKAVKALMRLSRQGGLFSTGDDGTGNSQKRADIVVDSVVEGHERPFSSDFEHGSWYELAMHEAREAATAATEALYDPSLTLAGKNKPMSHYVGTYIPLTLPLSVVLLQSLAYDLKGRFKKRKKRKLEKEREKKLRTREESK